MLAVALSLLLSSASFSSCPVDAASPIAPLAEAVTAAAPKCANLPAKLDGYVTLHIPVVKYDCRAPVRGMCDESYTNLALPMSVMTGWDGTPYFDGAAIGPDCSFSRTWSMNNEDGTWASETIKGYVDSDGSFVVTSYVRQRGTQYAMDPRPRVEITEQSTGAVRGRIGDL